MVFLKNLILRFSQLAVSVGLFYSFYWAFGPEVKFWWVCIYFILFFFIDFGAAKVAGRPF